MATLNKIRILWGVIIILVLVNVFTIVTLWISRSHKPPPEFNRKSKKEFLEEHLGFNEEQIKKFESIKSTHFGEIKTQMDSIRLLREELLVLMRKQVFNGDAEKLIEKIGAKQTELEKMNFRHFREVLGICDENQKEAFIETMKKAYKTRYFDYRKGDSFRNKSGEKEKPE